MTSGLVRISRCIVALAALMGCAAAQMNIFSAAQSGTVSDVRAAIAAGATVEARTENGWTPLMLAARYNERPAVTAELLSAGAEARARDPDGWTPLMFAARDNPNPAVIAVLVGAGADPNGSPARAERPLALALHHNSISVARELTRLGARPQGIPSLSRVLRESPHSGTLELLELLLGWLSLDREDAPALQVAMTPIVVNPGTRPIWTPARLPSQPELYRTVARSQLAIDVTIRERSNSEMLGALVEIGSEGEILFLPLVDGRSAFIILTSSNVLVSGHAALIAEVAAEARTDSISVLVLEKDRFGTPISILWVDSLGDVDAQGILGDFDVRGLTPLQRRIIAGTEPLGRGATIVSRVQAEIQGVRLVGDATTVLESVDDREASWREEISLRFNDRVGGSIADGRMNLEVTSLTRTLESVADPIVGSLVDLMTMSMLVELDRESIALQTSSSGDGSIVHADWSGTPPDLQRNWLIRAIDGLTELLLRGSP